MRSSTAKHEADDDLIARIEIALLRALLDTIDSYVESGCGLGPRGEPQTARLLAFWQAARLATAQAATIIAQAAQLAADAPLSPELPELRHARALQPIAPALARYVALTEALEAGAPRWGNE